MGVYAHKLIIICFLSWERRSGRVKAANGVAVLPIVVGRIDVAGAVEVEVVGVAAV